MSTGPSTWDPHDQERMSQMQSWVLWILNYAAIAVLILLVDELG